MYSSCVALVLCAIGQVSSDYWDQRNQLIKKEQSAIVGSTIVLNEKETIANEYLMKLKSAEIELGFLDPDRFLPSQHFFRAKSKIDESEVFKILQKVPKGAILHIHDLAMASSEYVFNLTLTENLYGCMKGDRIFLSFLGNGSDCHWKLLTEYRKENSTFNDFIKSQITIIREHPEEIFTNINLVWNEFSKTFGTIFMMITYKPIFVEYFYHALEEIYQDNVMYVELRTTLPSVYNLDGTILSPAEVVQLYFDTTQKFITNHPDFLGVKIIYAPSRHVNSTIVETYLETAIKLIKQFPNFVIGFDLVGQEDIGYPLTDFVEDLVSLNGTIKYFFHAAETNWYYEHTDLNIVDAVLLNTSRIGHGFGSIKHPEVLRLIKERNIAIELNPISNQVLKLVGDIRNHPGTFLISQNYPVVVSCDDPGFWGAKGVSYDWYYAFMGMSPSTADLKVLKQLAINSLNYSAMKEEDKNQALEKWTEKWDSFIEDIVKLNVKNFNLYHYEVELIQ